MVAKVYAEESPELSLGRASALTYSQRAQFDEVARAVAPRLAAFARRLIGDPDLAVGCLRLFQPQQHLPDAGACSQSQSAPARSTDATAIPTGRSFRGSLHSRRAGGQARARTPFHVLSGVDRVAVRDRLPLDEPAPEGGRPRRRRPDRARATHADTRAARFQARRDRWLLRCCGVCPSHGWRVLFRALVIGAARAGA
jgi:hypothetical protein